MMFKRYANEPCTLELMSRSCELISNSHQGAFPIFTYVSFSNLLLPLAPTGFLLTITTGLVAARMDFGFSGVRCII